MNFHRYGWLVFLAVLMTSVFLLWSQEGEDKSLLLKIGDERYRDKVLDVVPDKIFSAKPGKQVPFSQMIAEMKDSRLVYIGESHDSLPMHEIQLKIIQALYSQDRKISIGLEMFPVTLQEVLNKWSLDILSRQEFIEEAEWYVTWNFNFNFYQGIFEFAKEHGIPVYALNVPREVIRKIRMSGWEALSEDEKKLVPQPALSNEDHRTLIRTIFESTELPHQMKGRGLEMAFEGLYRAQSAWDEAMAHYALQALDKDGGKIVVLAGSGHLLYNLGINMRAFEKSKFPFKTVISIPVPGGKEGVRVSRTLADYVWGIPEEDKPAFPTVGLSFKKFDGLENLVIDADPIQGVAKGQDFKKGDVVLSVDEKNFTDINRLRMYLARFAWGEEAAFRLLRTGQEKEAILKFLQVEDESSGEGEKKD